MNLSEIYSRIDQPTLILDEAITRQNIRRMAEKARLAGVRFRPHFKTHQSAEIGEWFKDEGVTAITVSSVAMAHYFANHGWQDITIAFPVNLRQIKDLDTLSGRVHLALLVENPEAVQALADNIHNPVDIWIKIDAGSRRTGIPWDQTEPILALAEQIRGLPRLRLAGLLTHSGHTYGSGDAARIISTFRNGVERLDSLRKQIHQSGFSGLEISVGDTPGCCLNPDFSPADEIRPGNFVFYDAMQAAHNVCRWQDVSITVACPVVAIHPERSTIILYGGAIHLSKDFYEANGESCYGRIGLPTSSGWTDPLEGSSLISLSQEHGIARLQPEHLAQIKPGDLVCIFPAHSCLAVSALGEYTTLTGQHISTLVHSV